MDYVAEVKRKYPYLKDEDVKLLVNRAKAIYVEHVFPYDFSISYDTYEIPPRYDMWILDCVTELIEREGFSSLTAYKENGVSFQYDNAGVSQGLLNRLPKFVGTV